MRGGLKLSILPCLLLLCATLPHLGQGDFRRDTGRYAAVGLYMWCGGDLLAPHLGPETPYFNKPPLALWVHGLSLKLVGRNLIAARLPSILAALGVVILSTVTARKIGSRPEALVGGMVLALTYEFFRRTREISLDFWQLLFVMVAMFLFVSGLKQRVAFKIVLSGVGIGLALLCKPFVALGVLPLFALWAIMTGRTRLLPALLGTLAVAVLVALPWHYYMYLRFGDAFIRQYLLHEVVGRAQGATGREPFYYYAVHLASSYWPWLLGFGYALYCRFWRRAPVRHADRDLVLLGTVWVGCVWLLISLFADKSPNYALPLYPMLSWIVGAGLCRLPWPKLRIWYRSGFKGLAPATVALLVVLSVAPIRFQEGPNRDWQALFAWMNKHSVRPSQLAQADLKPNERAYFYVKTRWWLPELKDGTRAEWVLAPRSRSDTNRLAEAVFTSGTLHVVSSTNWPEIIPNDAIRRSRNQGESKRNTTDGHR